MARSEYQKVVLMLCERCGALLLSAACEEDLIGPIIRCVICGHRIYLEWPEMAQKPEHHQHYKGRSMGATFTCICGKEEEKHSSQDIFCAQCRRDYARWQLVKWRKTGEKPLVKTGEAFKGVRSGEKGKGRWMRVKCSYNQRAE